MKTGSCQLSSDLDLVLYLIILKLCTSIISHLVLLTFINEGWYSSKFKLDELLVLFVVPPPVPTGGYLWRFSTGVLSTTTGAITGAVGMSVGGVKWVAGKGYNAGTAVGSAVIDTTKSMVSKVPVPTLKKKSKKE